MTTMEKVAAASEIALLAVKIPANQKKLNWFRKMSEAISIEVTVLVAELIALTSNCQEQF